MNRNRSYELTEVDRGERLNDIGVASEVFKQNITARAMSKSFSVQGKSRPYSISLNGTDIKKVPVSYLVTLVSVGDSPEKFFANVKRNNEKPVMGVLARTLVQAAKNGASIVDKMYMGEI